MSLYLFISVFAILIFVTILMCALAILKNQNELYEKIEEIKTMEKSYLTKFKEKEEK